MLDPAWRQRNGLILDLPSQATKWIELMREAVPGLERIAFGWQRSTGLDQLDVAFGAARVLSAASLSDGVFAAALVDSRLDKAKVCSDRRVNADRLRLRAVLGEEKRF